MLSSPPTVSIQAANDELRRLRRRAAREERSALRFVIAGDPAKPVRSLAIPTRPLKWLGMAAVLVAGLAALVRWQPPARWLDALSNVLGRDAEAAAPPPPDSPRSIDLDHMMLPRLEAQALPDGRHFDVEVVNTGKTIKVKIGARAGEPDEESYRALRHELRCQKSGAESPIDPRLIELLYRIAVESNSRIQIVSAFRAQLRPGKLNYHTKGMAADIRVPGLSTEEVRDLARTLGATGVGYYPTVQFVHVDVRPVPYFWTDTSGHNERSHDEDDRVDAVEPGAVSSTDGDLR